MPHRAAEQSRPFCGRHKGGARVIVAKLFTCVTVNGSVPLGEVGAASYSDRRP
jgi:hypothetical protein